MFKAADFDFKNSCLKFRPYGTFFWANLVSKLQSALFRMKLSTKEYLGVQILNLAIVFLYSVPKIPLGGGGGWRGEEFGPKILECIVWTETWYKGAFKDVNSEFDNCFRKFGS